MVILLRGKEVLELLTTVFFKIDDGENLLRIRLLDVFPEEGTILLHIDDHVPEGRMDVKMLYE